MPTPPRVADVFDALATTYDQTGMPFFRAVGARLVEQLAPQPGDRALDIGCGRGAVTIPLARAVEKTGAVLAVDDLLVPYAPPGLLDPRASGSHGPFSSADATRALFQGCGAEVQLTTEAFTLPFADVADWERFSRTTGQSAMWRRVPDDDLPRLRAQAAEILDGPLVWEIRFWTTGR